MVLWLDTETYSAVDLKSAGTPRYAEDPSTEITIAQWAVDDGDVVVEDLTGRQPPSAALLSFLTDDEVRVVIHNSAFDRAVIRHAWGIDLAPQRIDDTMVMAMLHGMPGSLDKLGPILGLPSDRQKDKRGHQLIMLFCKPRANGQRVLPSDRPEEWAEFMEYARQDIVAVRELYRRLPKENWGSEHALWCLDQQINDRGFLVDTELAQGAIRAAKRAKDRMAERTLELTDEVVASATQRQQMLDYLNSVMGCDLPDLKAATVRTALAGADLPPDVREMLEIRLSSSKTTIGKYQALLRAVSADGRLRNTLQFSGAVRTSRWCLAEGSMVLVAEPSGAISEKPIEHVMADDLVFDGDDWVRHEGVVFSGDKPVISYDGVTATAEHVVYTEANASCTLQEAKDKGAKLWRGSFQFT